MHFQILNKSIDIPSDHLAIVSEKESISYEQLKKETNHLSGYLYSIGIKKGSHVSILCENNADFIILILSLWEIGAVPIPMNIRLLDEEIEKLIEHSKSEYIFVHHNLDKRLKGKNKRIVFPLEIYTHNSTISSNNFETDDTALILYTSGTTGSAKGVMLSYNNLISSAVSADYIINHTHRDRWLASLPFYHIGGFSIPIRAFLYGATVLIADSVKVESIVEILSKLKPTLASFVSTTLKQLLEKSIRPNPELRLVLLGGGPIDDELASGNKDGVANY
jgi:O-succinylbenzoic acid--CoA ligase